MTIDTYGRMGAASSQKCRPPVIFGEQVANAVSKGWLDDVYQGLEAEDYAVGSTVLPACSVGAPHRRDRLWFVGNVEHNKSSASALEGSCEASIQHNTQGQDCASKLEGASESQQLPVSALANNKRERSQGQRELQRSVYSEESGERQTNKSFDDSQVDWEDGMWVDCPDGKQRLIEPTIPLLVDGDTERVGLIHAAGDAIVPQVAASFIECAKEVI